MKVVLSAVAAGRLESQVAYLRDVGAEEEHIEIVTVWHTAQNRSAAQK